MLPFFGAISILLILPQRRDPVQYVACQRNRPLQINPPVHHVRVLHRVGGGGGRLLCHGSLILCAKRSEGAIVDGEAARPLEDGLQCGELKTRDFGVQLVDCGLGGSGTGAVLGVGTGLKLAVDVHEGEHRCGGGGRAGRVGREGGRGCGGGRLDEGEGRRGLGGWGGVHVGVGGRRGGIGALWGRVSDGSGRGVGLVTGVG